MEQGALGGARVEWACDAFTTASGATATRAEVHRLHLRQLAKSRIELLLLLLRSQSLFVIERVSPSGDRAAERNSAADLHELEEGHGDDDGGDADAVSCECFCQLGAGRDGTASVRVGLPAKAFLRSGGRLCVKVELMLRSCDDMSAASFCRACGDARKYAMRIAGVP